MSLVQTVMIDQKVSPAGVVMLHQMMTQSYADRAELARFYGDTGSSIMQLGGPVFRAANITASVLPTVQYQSDQEAPVPSMAGLTLVGERKFVFSSPTPGEGPQFLCRTCGINTIGCDDPLASCSVCKSVLKDQETQFKPGCRYKIKPKLWDVPKDEYPICKSVITKLAEQCCREIHWSDVCRKHLKRATPVGLTDEALLPTTARVTGYQSERKFAGGLKHYIAPPHWDLVAAYLHERDRPSYMYVTGPKWQRGIALTAMGQNVEHLYAIGDAGALRLCFAQNNQLPDLNDADHEDEKDPTNTFRAYITDHFGGEHLEATEVLLTSDQGKIVDMEWLAEKMGQAIGADAFLELCERVRKNPGPWRNIVLDIVAAHIDEELEQFFTKHKWLPSSDIFCRKLCENGNWGDLAIAIRHGAPLGQDIYMQLFDSVIEASNLPAAIEVIKALKERSPLLPADVCILFNWRQAGSILEFRKAVHEVYNVDQKTCKCAAPAPQSANPRPGQCNWHIKRGPHQGRLCEKKAFQGGMYCASHTKVVRCQICGGCAGECQGHSQAMPTDLVSQSLPTHTVSPCVSPECKISGHGSVFCTIPRYCAILGCTHSKKWGSEYCSWHDESCTVPGCTGGGGINCIHRDTRPQQTLA